MNRSHLAWIVVAASLTGCVVELRDGAAQDACSELNAVFCARLSECEPSVNEEACITADDGLGGPCANASVVQLEGDVETCKQAIADMECARIEARTSPDFDLDCVGDIQFDD